MNKKVEKVKRICYNTKCKNIPLRGDENYDNKRTNKSRKHDVKK